MDAMQSYYDKAFAENAKGNIYRPFNRMERLSHGRKMQLLDTLQLPDLSKATGVDYGVGSWGFGCVFPALKRCRHAIGIDISERAVELSRELSSKDAAMRGRKVEYRVSTGYTLPLDDASVDLFFAGECIEHIDDTEAFLTEVHRCLKVGGLAVFTTPNARPFVYRQLGLRWCVGFEHTALMDYAELKGRLEAFFHVEQFLGFNQSLHPAVDDTLDEATALAWVNASPLDPADATGLIASVRKRAARHIDPVRVESVESQRAAFVSPGARQVSVAPGYDATLLTTGQQLRFKSPAGAVRCSLILWSHPWSGTAKVIVGSETLEVALYSHLGGCQRLTVPCKAGETIAISALDKKVPQSQGLEVIVLRAVFACAPADARA